MAPRFLASKLVGWLHLLRIDRKRDKLLWVEKGEERMKMMCSVADISLNSLIDIQVVMLNREFHVQT